jgi:hypothetical protein
VLVRLTAAGARVVCASVGVGLLAAVAFAIPALMLPEVRAWLAIGGWWMALAAAAVGLALHRAGQPLGALLMRPRTSIFAALAFAVALGSGAWAHFAIEKGVPDVPDELSYLHQARGFADGELAPASPPLEEFYYTSWAIHDGGRWYSVFPPGYGALLALGVLAGVPWLVNPLLGALLVLILFALARDLSGGDGPVARLAILVYLASWFRLMHAGSFMSHPTAALLTVLAVLGAWRGVVAGGSRGWAALAGVAGALLLATRPLNAVLLAVVLVPFVIGKWRRLMLPVLVAAPLAVGYGLYNRALTGSALLPPQQRYMTLKEEVGDCFRLGFGPGVGQCPITQSTNFGKEGFQPRDAAVNTGRRMDALLRYSFAFAPLALLPGLGGLIGALAAAAEARRRALAAGVFLAAVLGYGLFFYHGVAYGARFYYESFPFLALLAGWGAVDAAGRLPGAPRAALGAAWLALLATGLVAAWPAVDQHAGQRRRTLDGAAVRALAAPDLADAVVFVDSQIVPAAVTRHPGAPDANHPLVVRDFGDAADAGFLRLHPRPAFRLVGTRLSPLHLPADAPVRHEGGALYPVEVAIDGFADRVTSHDVYQLPLSEGAALRFRGRRAGARFAFPTWVPDADAGPLVVRVATVMHPGGASAQLSVDGHAVGPTLATRSATPALQTFDVPVTLTAGRHTIGIAIDAPATFYLDHLELGRVPPSPSP